MKVSSVSPDLEIVWSVARVLYEALNVSERVVLGAERFAHVI